MRGLQGREVGVNRSGIQLGQGHEQPEKGWVCSAPGRALPPPACGRAGSYVPGRMQPVARGRAA